MSDEPAPPSIECRACGAGVVPVVDLGPQPAAGTFPLIGDPPGERLPLRLGVCRSCGLSQLADQSPPERDDPDGPSLFSSSTMVAHARGLAADLVGRGILGGGVRVLTVASHGAHPIQFLRELGLGATILEGSDVRAGRLRAVGEDVLYLQLDGPEAIASPFVGSFDLIVDLYFVGHLERPRLALQRLASLLGPGGTLVLEYTDFAASIRAGQWDTVGHGHLVYLTLEWLVRELEALGLGVVDVAPQPVFGGAMRVIARAGGQPGSSVGAVLELERSAGIGGPDGLVPLAAAVARARREVVPYLREAAAAGKRIVGYGAPGRAITFLNSLEIGPQLLPFVVDRAISKQGRTIPGVGIPILAPEVLAVERPDEVLILTWNLQAEVRAFLAPHVARGMRLLVAVPRLADVTAADPGQDIPPGIGDVR